MNETVQRQERKADSGLVIQVLSELITRRLTYTQAGEKFGIHPKTIAYWAKKAGYKRAQRRLDWTSIKKALKPIIGDPRNTISASKNFSPGEEPLKPKTVMGRKELSKFRSDQAKKMWADRKAGRKPMPARLLKTKTKTIIATSTPANQLRKSLSKGMRVRLDRQANRSQQRTKLNHHHCIGSQPIGSPMSDEAYLKALKSKTKSKKPKRVKLSYEEQEMMEYQHFDPDVEVTDQF